MDKEDPIMKKLVSLFLALAMVMSLTCVFAEGQEEVTLTVGSI